MQPEKLPADYAEQVRDAKRHILNADIRGAFDEYHRIEFGKLPFVTDEQRAEFLAHVAHTIGLDLNHGANLCDFLDAYDRVPVVRDQDGN